MTDADDLDRRARDWLSESHDPDRTFALLNALADALAAAEEKAEGWQKLANLSKALLESAEVEAAAATARAERAEALLAKIERALHGSRALDFIPDDLIRELRFAARAALQENER